ncbi:MAG: PIN domain-containing protein [Acidimicrobiales bacterium]
MRGGPAEHGLVLDAGALIAYERGDRLAVGLIERAKERGAAVTVPVGALAQVWRDGRLQVRLVRLLSSAFCEVVPLDDFGAREAGQLLGVTGTSDVVDATVVRCARQRGLPVLTSDTGDLRRLDRKVRLIPV